MRRIGKHHHAGEGDDGDAGNIALRVSHGDILFDVNRRGLAVVVRDIAAQAVRGVVETDGVGADSQCDHSDHEGYPIALESTEHNGILIVEWFFTIVIYQ